MPTSGRTDSIQHRTFRSSVSIEPYAALVDAESSVTDGLVEISIDNGLASVHDLESRRRAGLQGPGLLHREGM